MEDQLIIPNQRDQVMNLLKTSHLGLVEIAKATNTQVMFVIGIYREYLKSFIE